MSRSILIDHQHAEFEDDGVCITNPNERVVADDCIPALDPTEIENYRGLPPPAGPDAQQPAPESVEFLWSNAIAVLLMGEQRFQSVFGGIGMFRVEFGLHVFYDKGITRFQREEQLPFVPMIGLDVLDDGFGEFKLEHVAWHSGSQMFLCQATVKREHESLQSLQRLLKKAGWTEDKEAREPYPRKSAAKSQPAVE